MTENKKYKLSEGFVQNLIDKAAGYLPPDTIELFLDKIQSESEKYFFDSSSEYNIQRILNSLFDRTLFISDSLRFPHYIEILVAIAVNSNYLCEIILRNPEYFYFILNPGNLTKSSTFESLYKELSQESHKFKNFQTKINYFKLFKRRIILQIGTKDILGQAQLKETTDNLSSLALALLSCLFELCYQQTLLKYNLSFTKNRYCLIALGKLGGKELNYSSDADLILFYDKNSKVGREKKIDYYDILTETCQLFIEKGTEISDRGFIYRIDFRLRPDGKNSPLCRTYADMMRYYEARGEEWERQMLIKTGFVCGNKKMFNDFSNYLARFTYTSSFSESPLITVARMKSSIEKQVPSDRNIKTGRGGIRDIEFLVQALQMLNGGKNPALQSGNTLDALEALARYGLLTEAEKELLQNSYVFFRHTEHFLQLLNDEQTHTIPEPGNTLEKLAKFSGLNNGAEFIEIINVKRIAVKKLFSELTGTDKEENINFELEHNFKNLNRAINNLEFLRSGAGPFSRKSFDTNTIKAFKTIKPKLIGAIISSTDPDRTLDNLTKIIRNYPFPSIIYSELRNDNFLKLFIKVCEFSQRAVDLMAFDKSLIDFFISRQIFVKDLKSLYKQPISKFIFVLLVQYTTDLIKYDKVSSELSKFLKHKIDTCFNSNNFHSKYFVAGLGSFGVEEMTFSSDLDLLIICEEDDNYPLVQNQFLDFLEPLSKALQPFQTDFRLRPEGNKGPIAWGEKSFSKYLSTRARGWEFQALHKMNFISGDSELFNHCKKLLIKDVKKIEDIKPQILNTRAELVKSNIKSGQSINLKKDPGGLIDIGFVLDKYILSDSKIYKSTFGKSVFENFKVLSKRTNNDSEFKQLKEIYALLKNIEIASQVIFNLETPVVAGAKFDLLNSFFSSNNAEEKLADALKKSDEIFRSVFN